MANYLHEICYTKQLIAHIRENDDSDFFEGGIGDWAYSKEVDYQRHFDLDQDDWGFAKDDPYRPTE